jgi:hypothetical protein
LGQYNTWPAQYANGIDTVFAGQGAYAGKAWFFKGNTYIVYDLASDKAETPPTPIDSVVWAGGNWPLKTFVGGVDFTFYGPAGTAFVLRGGMAIECDLGSDTVVDGPFWVEDRWPSFVDGFYSPNIRWGVDSLNTATHIVGGKSLYEYVVEKLGVQPRFWGRYLGTIDAAEVGYLHDRDVRVLPIFRGVGAQQVQGDRTKGQTAGQQAIDSATLLGVPAGKVVFLNIEPGWKPSKDFILGWWDKFEPSQFYEGLYANPKAFFGQTYPAAYAARGVQVPPMTASKLVWSQQPQSSCLAARLMRSEPFIPAITVDSAMAPVNEDCHVFWQLKINCLPQGGIGLIDHDLATLQFFDWLW